MRAVRREVRVDRVPIFRLLVEMEGRMKQTWKWEEEGLEHEEWEHTSGNDGLDRAEITLIN